MTSEGTEILSKKDLEDVLSTSIGGFGVWNEDTSGTSVQVESFKVTSLVKPGDNYASNIMAVDVTLAENHRKLSLVAKLVPQSEALKNMLESSTIFKKEISFYSLILPRLEEIQREKRLPTRELLDIFPTYYGSRSPGEGGVEDGSFVLLIENLKPLGYKMANRVSGLDLDHVTLVVSQMARFHALGIAVKIQKPLVFRNMVIEAIPPPPPQEEAPALSLDDESLLESTIRNFMERFDRLPGHIPDKEKLKDAFMKGLMSFRKYTPPPISRYSTFIHNDFWANNILFRYNFLEAAKENCPKSLKLVDFQQVSYDSPVKDLIYFLFTSSADSLVVEHYEDLVTLYHNSFITQLSQLGCATESYSFESFQAEIDVVAPKVFCSAMFMIAIATRAEDDIDDLATFDISSFLMNSENLSPAYLNRLSQLVIMFDKNGWL